MNSRRVISVSLVLALAITAGGSYGVQLLYDKAAGITIGVPSGWNVERGAEIEAAFDRHYLPPDQPKPSISNIVFRILKYEEPTDKLNPTVHIIKMPLGDVDGRQAVDILYSQIEAQSARRPIWAERPEAMNFQTGEAARAIVETTVRTNEGVEYQFRTRILVVLRASDYVWVQLSGAREGPDASEDEFDAILASLTIEF